MLTGHPGGYRIPRGGQKNSVGGRLPFLSRSLQFFTIAAVLKTKSGLLPRHKRPGCIVVGTFTLPRGPDPSAHSRFSGALGTSEDGKTVYRLQWSRR